MKGIAIVPNAAVRIIDSKNDNSKPWVEENMTRMNQNIAESHENAHSIDNNVNNITCSYISEFSENEKS